MNRKLRVISVLLDAVGCKYEFLLIDGLELEGKKKGIEQQHQC